MLNTAAVFDSSETSRLGVLDGELLWASSLAAALALAEEAKMLFADLRTEYNLFFDALSGPS